MSIEHTRRETPEMVRHELGLRAAGRSAACGSVRRDAFDYKGLREVTENDVRNAGRNNDVAQSR